MKLRRWVIKAGSQMVCEGGPLLMRTWMQQVARLRKDFNIEIIWVTSGAIAWATEKTEFKEAKRTLPQKQALSAIGQPLIMDQYNLALATNGLLGSQILLTAGDIKNKIRKANLSNSIEQLLAWKAIPILNENDAVATEEIQFGDNDSLAAQVAVMMKAHKLILLTDVDGLFNKDPKTHSDARLIPYVKKIGSQELNLSKMTSKKIPSRGTGGMLSKLNAAKLANQNNITTHLLRGDIPQNLLQIAQGQNIGTQVGGKFGK